MLYLPERRVTMRNYVAGFVGAIILLMPFPAHAVSQWTAAGTTGTIASPNLRYEIHGSLVSYLIASGNGGGMSYSSEKSGVDPFRIAYNITSSELQPLWTTLTMGYSGVVSGTSAVATLYRVAPAGNQTMICSAASTTTKTLTSCSFSSTSFDFSSYAYYVEVVVDRNSTSQLPTVNYLSVK
jgi:hypothetical protein